MSIARSSRGTICPDKKVTDEKPIVFSEDSNLPPSELTLLVERPGLSQREYWEVVIGELENSIHCSARAHIPEIDYSIVLPPRLKKRIKRILPYEFSEDDRQVYRQSHLIEQKPEDYIVFADDDDYIYQRNSQQFKIIELRSRTQEVYIEETEFSDVVRMEHEFNKFELKLDEPVGHTAGKKDKENWLGKFLCKPRKQRIVWRTKVYTKDYDVQHKSLDDQAEDLMDASAEIFIDWLNSVGSAMPSGITVTKLKELFSIKGDRTLLASIKTDPKEVNAIAKTVAEQWDSAEMAIELQFEKYVNSRAYREKKPQMLSAFGRTIPAKERIWTKSSTDVPIETIYPQELITREKLFKGIRHLRSTLALIDFYYRHPKLRRPEYLVALYDFDLGMDSLTNRQVPLYEKLGLRY